jgi:hypothetical protein
MELPGNRDTISYAAKQQSDKRDSRLRCRRGRMGLRLFIKKFWEERESRRSSSMSFITWICAPVLDEHSQVRSNCPARALTAARGTARYPSKSTLFPTRYLPFGAATSSTSGTHFRNTSSKLFRLVTSYTNKTASADCHTDFNVSRTPSFDPVSQKQTLTCRFDISNVSTYSQVDSMVDGVSSTK